MATKRTPKKPAAKAKSAKGVKGVKVAKVAKSPKPALAPESPKRARTASGKPANAERMEAAAKDSVVGLKERLNEGMRASGMFAPIKDEVFQRRANDDAIGDFSWALTEDERLLQHGGPKSDFRATDPWRVMRITSACDPVPSGIGA